MIVDNVAGTAVKLWVGDLPKHGPLRRDQAARRRPRRASRPPREGSRRAASPTRSTRSPSRPPSARTRSRTSTSTRPSSRASRSSRPTCATTATSRSRRRCSATSARSRRTSSTLRPKLYRPGDKIGKAGVEATLDEYLRGEAGQAQIRVDSLGRPQGPLEPRRERAAGQRRPADDRHRAPARGGARAAATGSRPRARERVVLRERRRARRARPARRRGARDGLDPHVQAVGLRRPRRPEEDRAARQRRGGAKKQNYPGINRVTSGEYPPGSTWKPVTALAAMQEHLLEPYQSLSVHADRDVRRSTSRCSSTGTRTSTSR